jgi:hypothetical protein
LIQTQFHSRTMNSRKNENDTTVEYRGVIDQERRIYGEIEMQRSRWGLRSRSRRRCSHKYDHHSQIDSINIVEYQNVLDCLS